MAAWPGDPGSEDDGARADPHPPHEDVMVGRLPGWGVLNIGDRSSGVELRTEPEGLDAGSLRQPHPGDAAREPEIVANHRTRPRLSPDRLRLDDDGVQAFRSSVDGCCQPGGPGADDHHIGDLVGGDRVVAAIHRLGGLRHGRATEELVAERPQQRKLHIGTGRLQDRDAFGRVSRVGPRGHP